ncbi:MULTISPECIES: ThuA domain-containing protein [Haloferax]|jgi:trehalose utilization protein|uniref:PalA n=3 Tax=Haloferax volcanii TaxID=2246 RepID=A0A384KSQ5_HALVD|nr:MULTISPECIES: trehalose utilization protein ThuA [Haloferax]ADE01297.1 ThuA family protein [Haloferax volcanii DS2]ELY36862.1 PalA [Haloferax volcanii DS2]MBS8118053.1 trehalose utilization protein ThuA [Haloferax volcanii]MBS8123065.1 trehalose utilization protein ThuA [Haloferax volcanii]MBS8126933.1 trehalose utilization protein ThuA [Haloferax volcanii]
MPTRVTVWNENVHEREEPAVAERYPTGIHGTIAAHLEGPDREVRTATLQEPEHGLDEATLDATDVLVWWSHCANDEVTDAVAERVVDRVHEGMGFIPLHSGKNSKPFTRLMGTTCNIKYRHGGERERVWVADPGHPIADGLDEQFVIPATETYGEPYDIPEPDRTVFISWFEGGDVFRSGVCYRRGRGRIFAFRPGHEEYPIFHQDEVKRVIDNAVEWATPTEGASARWGKTDPLEHVEE